ncbi:MAG: hypothetical protein WBD31_00560 [Rubripirellula sp.]
MNVAKVIVKWRDRWWCSISYVFTPDLNVRCHQRNFGVIAQLDYALSLPARVCGETDRENSDEKQEEEDGKSESRTDVGFGCVRHVFRMKGVVTDRTFEITEVGPIGLHL